LPEARQLIGGSPVTGFQNSVKAGFGVKDILHQPSGASACGGTCTAQESALLSITQLCELLGAD